MKTNFDVEIMKIKVSTKMLQNCGYLEDDVIKNVKIGLAT